MRKTAVLSIAAALACCAGIAGATQYPPGPGGANPDTLLFVRFVQNPAENPNPVPPDTVWGIGGIVTGFDTFPTGFAIYIQNRASGANGAPWTGLDIFTGGNNYQPPNPGTGWPGLQRGDSVVCYGRVEEFQGETELINFNGAFGSDRIRVRRVSTGNPLPAFHVGTVASLQELPTNPNAEQWEGCLVRVNGPMRVARTSLTGGLGTFSSIIAVDDITCPTGSAGPCDSLFVDGSTLANPAFSPASVGTQVDMVQGIYNQRTRGYRIQLRDGNDIIVATPPGVNQAFSVARDTVRVLFDRNVTQATAENVNNYELSSLRPILSATLVESNAVHLAIDDTGPNGPLALPVGANEAVTVTGIASQANGLVMTAPAVLPFINGVLSPQMIQAPDKAALGGMGCEDRSRYAGAGATIGTRLTYRGVCVKIFGSVAYLMDPAGGTRSGMASFAAIAPLVEGRRYLLAGAAQEFFNETQGTQNVYLRDEGPAAIPAPVVSTVAALRDTNCDASQSALTGEDYEGVLVRVEKVMITESRSAGLSFFVAGHAPTFSDTILIVNANNSYTFAADSGNIATITGILRFAFGTFRIYPRSNADIVNHGTGQLAVGDGPGRVTFAVFPNPARTARVSFGLPRAADVELGVYDVAGRQVAVLARGRLAAGTHSREWSGLDARGNPVGSGMFFYRLRVGAEEHVLRAVRLD